MEINVSPTEYSIQVKFELLSSKVFEPSIYGCKKGLALDALGLFEVLDIWGQT
jgi:hypothetical protein